jgi:hypothetical protein
MPAETNNIRIDDIGNIDMRNSDKERFYSMVNYTGFSITLQLPAETMCTYDGDFNISLCGISCQVYKCYKMENEVIMLELWILKERKINVILPHDSIVGVYDCHIDYIYLFDVNDETNSSILLFNQKLIPCGLSATGRFQFQRTF